MTLTKDSIKDQKSITDMIPGKAAERTNRKKQIVYRQIQK